MLWVNSGSIKGYIVGVTIHSRYKRAKSAEEKIEGENEWSIQSSTQVSQESLFNSTHSHPSKTYISAFSENDPLHLPHSQEISFHPTSLSFPTPLGFDLSTIPCHPTLITLASRIYRYKVGVMLML